MIKESVLFIALLVNACGVGNAPVSQPPLHIVVLYDVSESAVLEGVPILTAAHIDTILFFLNRRGGELSFAAIDEDGFEPMLRVPLQPVDRRLRLDQRARLNQQNQRAVREFRALVKEQISRPRDAQISDLKGVLERSRVYFSQPQVDAVAKKVLLVISDGRPTGPRKQMIVLLSSEVEVFCVGMKEDAAVELFPGGMVKLFDDIDAALNYLFSTL